MHAPYGFVTGSVSPAQEGGESSDKDTSVYYCDETGEDPVTARPRLSS